MVYLFEWLISDNWDVWSFLSSGASDCISYERILYEFKSENIGAFNGDVKVIR